MSEADIEARAETIAELFLESNAAAQVEAEAKAEFVSKIGGMLKSGTSMLATTVLPALAMIIGLKLISPYACQLMNGGMPCPYYMPPKPAGDAPPAAAQVSTAPSGPQLAETEHEEETALAQLLTEDDYAQLMSSHYAHL